MAKANFWCFFMTCRPFCANISLNGWNKRKHSLVIVSYHVTKSWQVWAPELSWRSAKGPRRIQWAKSTSPLPSLHACGHIFLVKTQHYSTLVPMFFLFLFSYSSFLFFFSIPVPFLFLSLLFLLLRWADEVCEETVSKDIANARHICIYIVLLVWLQACPSSHRERSANEVVAWVSRMPSWPRKQNERIRERPLWAQRVRIVFFSCAFSRLNWPQIKVG